jgi:FkbH-like protein
VVHKINWISKVENVVEICASVGIGFESVLFIDDSATEREFVRSACSGIRVIGENFNNIRRGLLTDPCLQRNIITSESERRTEMVKAQLQRDSVKSEWSSTALFLQNLDIRLTIEKLQRTDRIPRVIELIQRTNQFNVTLVRLSSSEVHSFLNRTDCAIYTLEARDRFSDYGTIGVCVIKNQEIIVFALSCRVIPLQLSVPFLSSALQDYAVEPIYGMLCLGPKNAPTRHFFQNAGFDSVDTNRFMLSSLERLARVDRNIYSVSWKNREK